jgi:hypothetical protein
MMRARRISTMVIFMCGLVWAEFDTSNQVVDAESLAGHWHLTFYGKCVQTANNVQACRDLQSPATFGIMGVPGSTLTVTGTGDYISDASGRFTVTFVTKITELWRRGHRPALCSNTLVFHGAYNGTCQERGTGRGHIAAGKTGMVDFWEDETSGEWNGNPGTRFFDAIPTDTMNPACPGVYNTARFMRLFGYTHVPPGITARLVLVKH